LESLRAVVIAIIGTNRRCRVLVMKRVVGILVTALAIWVAVTIVPGLDFSGEWWAFLLVALILSVINAVVKPIVKLLSLPAVILTLGLFLLVINALMLSLTVWLADPARLDLGLTSDGFFWATFLGALVISIVQSVVNLFIDAD
jgi:putative membrane protein